MASGRILILTGLILLVAGLWITYGPKIPLLGKLPGDIRIEKENFTLYIPLGTSLLISALLSLLFWIFRR